jgi:4-hydroxyphenylpyruvate dioxygenase-like putative hemolysin
MSVIRKLLNFLIRLLGGEEKKPTTQSVVVDKAYCMKEDVIQVLVNGHPFDEQAKIREYIRKQEEQGIYNYTFETSRWKVVVRSTSGHGAQFMTQVKEQEGTSY